MKIVNSFLLSVLVTSLFSCEDALEMNQKFRFKVDDSLAKYDMDIYARVSPGFKGENIPFVMTILSPDGKRYRDTLSFSTSIYSASRPSDRAESGVWKDFKWNYRKNITFPGKGVWLVSVRHLSERSNLDNISDFEITVNRK